MIFFSKCTALGKNGEHGCISDEGDPLIWEDTGKLELGLYRAYLIGITAQRNYRNNNGQGPKN